MRLVHFSATDVHGRLPFDISFRPDLTFLIGLNGCGKTTALRLIHALLGPSIEVLARLSFAGAVLTVELSQSEQVTIRASNNRERLRLEVDGATRALEIAIPDNSISPSVRRDILERSALEQSAHDVVIAIRRLGSPMFLGLERRHIDSYARQARHRSHWVAEANHAASTPDPIDSLKEVQELLRDVIVRVQADEVRIDQEFRKRVLLDAVTYVPSPAEKAGYALPRKKDIESVRKNRAAIEQLGDTLGIPAAQLKSQFDTFFERTDAMLAALEAVSGPSEEQTAKKGSRRRAQSYTVPPAVLNLMLSGPIIQRTLSVMQAMAESAKRREEAWRSVDKFRRLVNSFLEQTNKRIERDQRAGYFEVHLQGGEKSLALSTLSSGEKQIVVMLAHLTINPAAEGGVFIVDEPELSLHIAWQEKFVAAIQEASPHTQLILATHSPAIVLGRDEHCENLSRD